MFGGRVLRSHSRACLRCTRQSQSRHASTSKTEGVRYSQPDEAKGMQPVLKDLIQPTGKWRLASDGSALERQMKFKGFGHAWRFMSDVADSCQAHRHHPEWSNTYNTVYVRWTTHRPAGLSMKDLTMARICDDLASRAESLEIDTQISKADTMAANELVQKSKEGAGDCCSPTPSSKDKEEEKQQIEEVESQEGKQGSIASIGQPS